MQKIALGTKLTSAFNTKAGKAKEEGQEIMTGATKDKLTKVPYMFKGASEMDIKEFAKECIELEKGAVSAAWYAKRRAAGLLSRAKKMASGSNVSIAKTRNQLSKVRGYIRGRGRSIPGHTAGVSVDAKVPKGLSKKVTSAMNDLTGESRRHLDAGDWYAKGLKGSDMGRRKSSRILRDITKELKHGTLGDISHHKAVYKAKHK